MTIATNQQNSDPITFAVERSDGTVDVLYRAQPHQLAYHRSTVPNLIMIGPRGTGKSVCMRFDAHMRATAIADYRYLVVRRTMPELRKSHISFLDNEMGRIGGKWLTGVSEAHYANGSIGWYGHCETEADVLKYLSAQYDLIIIDEVTTFDQETILKLAACLRVIEGSHRVSLLRGGTNPLGPGAEFVLNWFINKEVDIADFPDYNPADYGVIETTFGDNKYVDIRDYRKRLANLPEHVRRAWLDGEWVVEGAYFADFRPAQMIPSELYTHEDRANDIAPDDPIEWHVIQDMPTLRGRDNIVRPVLDYPWIQIYRAIDWGYSPDPAVCLWIAVMPDNTEIVFKEMTWRSTIAQDVARDIKRLSEGMRIVDTFADPSMFAKSGETIYSVGELFENNGVAITKSLNDRALFGYAIHDHLNTLINRRPKLRILAPGPYGYGCPQLIKTLPKQVTDDKDPRKIAASKTDHWTVALAYYCMGEAPPSKDPLVRTTPRWMQPRRMQQGLHV